ncbi:MAG TPA: pilin [Verrucomicrobiae bacterium]|nr:pilin [Verrucomicrobiae bacterium]
MFQKLKFLYAVVAIGAAVGTPVIAHAASPFSLPKPKQNLDGGSTPETTLTTLATRVIDIIFLLAGILAVIYLLWSGIQYITAGGNADKVKAARQGIINAVIGIVVIMAAFFIIRIATSTRGFFDKGVTGTTTTTQSTTGGGLGQ